MDLSRTFNLFTTPESQFLNYSRLLLYRIILNQTKLSNILDLLTIYLYKNTQINNIFFIFFIAEEFLASPKTNFVNSINTQSVTIF